MAKNVNHVSHIKSTSSAITSGNSVFIADGKAGPKLPVASTLIQGEIAVNLAKDVETLSIVNTSGEIVTFSSDKIIKKVIVDNEQVTAAALNDLEERKQNKLTAGDGITINDDVISATASITPVDLPISGDTEDFTKDDVPTAYSVLDRFLADEDRMGEIEVVTSAALNDLNSRVDTVSGDVETLKTSVANKVDNSTYATYTANTKTILDGKQGALTAGDNITITSGNVISATDTTYTAGEGISISSSNVISNTAITVVDDELNSGSTRPVANSAVTAAISALTVEVRNNELVDAAALNDLNSRKLDASAITGYATEEWVTNQGYLTEHQSLSGYATTAVTNQLRNDVNTLSGNAITSATYVSSAKTITFTTSTGKTIDIDATNFIKDGMVDKVVVSGVTSGESTVECLVVTFNTDAGKEDIEIPLSDMFDSSLYYTKIEIDDKLGSGFTGSNSGVTVTQAINDSEKVVAAALNDLNNRKLDASAITGYATEEWVNGKLGSGFTGDNSGTSVTQVIEENGLVVAAALNDLNNRKLDASAYTPTDLSNFYTKPEIDGHLSAKAETTWVEEKLGSGFTGDNSGNTVTKVIEENELVVAASLNDLNSRKLDASALTEIQEAISDKQDALSAGTNITIEDNVISAAEYVAGSGITISGTNNEVSVKIVELRSGATYADDEIPSAKSVKQAIVDNELVVASALNDLEERKLDASAFTETADALETLSGEVASKELVVAASLNDLNTRLIEVSGDVEDHTSAITELSNRINTLDPEVVKVVTGLPSIDSSDISTGKIYLVKNDSSTESGTSGNVYTEYVYVSGQTGGNRWEKIGEWKPEMSVDTTLSSSSTNPVQNKVVKSAIDNKQDKLTAGSGITIDSANTISVKIDTNSDTWSSGSTGVPATSALAEVLEEIEEVTATALNDLNDRLIEVSGSQLTASSFKTINGQTIVGSGSISIEGSGGGQANVIETVKVNGTALTPDANKAVDITSVPASIVTQDASHRFVSDSEKSTWNNKQNAFSNASTLSGISATNVTNWNSVTAKTDTTAFTAHTGDTTAHVTSAEKTQWNNAISGVSFNGTDATVTNGKAIISGDTAQKVLLEVVDEGSGNISFKNYGESTTLSPVEVKAIFDDKTKDVVLIGDYVGDNICYHLSSIDENNQIYQFSNVIEWVRFTDSRKFYRLVKLDIFFSEVDGNLIVQGGISEVDLTSNASFTAHTADTSVHVTSTDKSTWNGKQDALSNASVLTGISSTNVTNWNNAATSAHSHSNKTVLDNLTQTVIDNSHTHSNQSVLDGITTAKTASWDTVTAKTDNTAFTAHTADTTIHVTATEKSTWNGKQDAISDLASIRTSAATQSDWNATSGVAQILNKPTIPSAPGTLTTTATTAQATATNEALSGNIALHKVSKTGNYNDLLNTPTIPAAANDATITLTFNGVTAGTFTVNQSTNQTIDIGTIIGLPSFSASNNGQILGVVNGALAWITPTTIYTGSGTPSSSQGNNGDIYLQTS